MRYSLNRRCAEVSLRTTTCAGEDAAMEPAAATLLDFNVMDVLCIGSCALCCVPSLTCRLPSEIVSKRNLGISGSLPAVAPVATTGPAAVRCLHVYSIFSPGATAAVALAHKCGGLGLLTHTENTSRSACLSAAALAARSLQKGNFVLLPFSGPRGGLMQHDCTVCRHRNARHAHWEQW